MLSTYAHVIDELDPTDRQTAEDAIRHARDRLKIAPAGPAAIAGKGRS